jgi:hypothetical protein
MTEVREKSDLEKLFENWNKIKGESKTESVKA